ncbi:hypothetical protein KGF54_000153 [Candida jiufengensis]|uniref:uncharacterized protein n=1 Tax=Candida jiufengensis TaxID=497108 RepID=UPI00222445FC|nr:uncharacterized protein KGF54_000153 [Candida jiufengensis]KAI5957225.1 hypothetical protein KGF54_000153 [Candida jiufengensis]
MPPSKDNSQQINPQTQWKNINNNNNSNMSNGQSQQNSNDSIYTLPGVINYLTSEFTNLERFKIITNLEKSEMKYKILHLQAEVDSLKFIKKKQQSKIESLEREVKILKGNFNSSSESQKEEEILLPEVDLDMIKKSRQQLKESMKEILTILKAPSSKLDQLNFPDNNENEFEELIDKNDSNEFNFTGSNLNNNNPPKTNVISRFFNEGTEEIEENETNEPKYINSDDVIDDVLEKALSNDSEAVTVILDDEPEIRQELEDMKLS